jgi:hypothetical protein
MKAATVTLFIVAILVSSFGISGSS